MKNKDKNLLYVIVVVLVITSLAFRILNDFMFEQTTLLFVGLPALITVLLIRYSKTPKSIYGVVFKTITLFLLMCAILFGEGLVCIIFMAPIFYGTAALLVGLISYIKNRDRSKIKMFVIVPLFLIYSQIHKINSQPEVQSIETIKLVDGYPDLNKLNQIPDFMKDFPLFFKIGFPKPISISGNGTEVGDFRKIKFKSNTKGVGTLHLLISEKNENQITFKIIDDDTHINHWLTWKEVTVSVKANKNNTSQITWTTKFTCDLGPQWYFEIVERYGVKVMNEHLINSFFQ